MSWPVGDHDGMVQQPPEGEGDTRSLDVALERAVRMLERHLSAAVAGEKRLRNGPQALELHRRLVLCNLRRQVDDATGGAEKLRHCLLEEVPGRSLNYHERFLAHANVFPVFASPPCQCIQNCGDGGL